MKKKVFMAILCTTVVTLFSGCGSQTVPENSVEQQEITQEEQSSDEAIENQEGEEEMTEENTVLPDGSNGELLKDTEDLGANTESQEEYTIDMENVTDVLCPAKASLKRAKTEYGTVEHFTYYSETTGCERGANILYPAGYEEGKKYPVLYFLHGIFGDENSMLNDSGSKIKEIMGNLKEDGIIGDVIVIFPNMYATGDPKLQPGFTAEQTAPYDNFINDLVNDLMPYAEEHFGAMTDRENRGIIGFSMGGRETLYIGTTRSDLFAYIGAVAPAPGLTPAKDWAMTHPGQMQEDELVIRQSDYQPNLLLVCCGTKDSVVGAFPASYHAIMEKNGVDHMWYEVPEADHDSNAIKSGLYNFLIRWQPGTKAE